MTMDRRSVLAMAAALPRVVSAAPVRPSAAPAVDTADLWHRLMAGPPGMTFAWWYHGTLYAHVDRLREFPVAGFNAIMICRTALTGPGLAVDFRTIGHFSDFDTALPTRQWHNSFTGRDQDIPAVFMEGPGRYTMAPAPDGPVLSLIQANSRTNRVIATAEATSGHMMLTQIEGTLQGFPQINGALPPLGSPAITERQTRKQLILPAGEEASVRGYFSHVYDALPPWLGFGEALGSGLIKGQMRRAGADETLDTRTWAYLRRQVPAAFSGKRLVLP